MQKKLMAIAVAGALAVPAAAYAAGSNLQITGRFTYEYGVVDGNNNPNVDMANNPGGSHIRVKGMEKLGGGLSAWFQCETSADVRGIDQDGLCTRNSAIGLKGGFGNLHFGVWDTPYKRALNAGTVGAEATGILGMSFIGFGGSGGVDAAAGSLNIARERWKRRERGLIYYESPKFSGFQVLGAFSAGDAATNARGGATPTVNNKPRVLSISGVYDNGPLEFGIGYEKHKQFGYAGATQDLDDDSWGLGLTYAFGKVEVGGFFHKDTYETGPSAETTKKTYGIGVNWRLPGPHRLEAQYVKADDSGGNGGSISTGGGNGSNRNGGVTGCGPTSMCADTGGDAWSVAYTYHFSKRTRVKFGYIYVDNDSNNRTYRVGSMDPTSVTNGQSQDAWAMKWRHDF